MIGDYLPKTGDLVQICHSDNSVEYVIVCRITEPDEFGAFSIECLTDLCKDYA